MSRESPTQEGDAQPTQRTAPDAPPAPTDDRLQTDYQAAKADFDRGQYGDAAGKFSELLQNAELADRKASAAYALGQCYRLSGKPTLALYAYRLAAREYSKRTDEAAARWRFLIREHLVTVFNNVAVVTLRYTGSVTAGRKPCGLTVDEMPLRGLPDASIVRTAMEKWHTTETESNDDTGKATPARAGSAFPPLDDEEKHRQLVLRTLDSGHIAGIPARIASAKSAPERLEEGATFLVDKTRDHTLQFQWCSAGGAAERTQRTLPDTTRLVEHVLSMGELESGALLVDLSTLDADVSYRVTPEERAHEANVRLCPEMREEDCIKLGSTGTSVKPNRYLVDVEIDSWWWREANQGTVVRLLPGEAREMPIRLERPFYANTLVLASIGAVLVAAAGYIVWTKYGRHDERDVNSGNLGWVIRVP